MTDHLASVPPPTVTNNLGGVSPTGNQGAVNGTGRRPRVTPTACAVCEAAPGCQWQGTRA